VRPLASGEPDAIDPHGLDLSFRATRGHRDLAGRGGCRSNRRTAWILLSWPCPLAPPRRAPAGASTPGRPQPKLLSAIGSGFQSRRRVPSAWFLTTSTASSAPGLWVCCAPLPASRFTAFPPTATHARPGPRSVTPWAGSRLPRNAVVTLQRVTLASSRTASLRPVPSCRYRRSDSPRGKAPLPITIAGERFQHRVRADDRGRRHEVQPTSRLCSAVESVALRHRFQCAAPAPPMGFCPLRGPRLPLRPGLPRPHECGSKRLGDVLRLSPLYASARRPDRHDRGRRLQGTEPRASLQWFPA